APERGSRLGYAHLLEHAQGLLSRRSGVLALMQADRLRDLLAYRINRVERSHRFLEDHRDLGAAYGAYRRGIGARENDALPGRPQKVEAAREDAPAPLLDQPHHR